VKLSYDLVAAKITRLAGRRIEKKLLQRNVEDARTVRASSKEGASDPLLAEFVDPGGEPQAGCLWTNQDPTLYDGVGKFHRRGREGQTFWGDSKRRLVIKLDELPRFAGPEDARILTGGEIAGEHLWV
jgi:hypothetical protein